MFKFDTAKINKYMSLSPDIHNLSTLQGIFSAYLANSLLRSNNKLLFAI